MAKFKAQLDKFQERAILRLDRVRRASIIEMFSLVIDATPVDEGFLRGGWQATVNVPSTQVLKRADPAGSKAKAQVLLSLGKITDVVWFTNTMPYAYRIEYEGWSAQARGGMVRSNLPKWQGIVDAKAREFK